MQNTSILQADKIAEAIIKSSNLNIADATDVEKQTIGALIFGAISAFSLSRGTIARTQVQAIIISIFIKKMGFSESAAGAFFSFLVECTKKEYHQVIYTIIHAGMDAYEVWEDADVLGVNVVKILNIIKGSTSN